MGFLQPSFNREGKGIDPNAPEKRGFFKLFEIYFRKFWHFARANLVYSLFLLPTFAILAAIVFPYINGLAAPVDESGLFLNSIDTLVFINLYIAVWGMGPATAGMTYIMRNFAREEHAWLWGDFTERTKSNFKQSIVVYILDLLALVIFYTAIVVYSNASGFIGYLKYVIYILLLLYSSMHLYIYPLMIGYEFKIKALYKTSFLFAMAYFLPNILILLVQVIIHYAIPMLIINYCGSFAMMLLTIHFIFEICGLQAFSGLIVNFYVNPKITQYINTTKGEN